MHGNNSTATNFSSNSKSSNSKALSPWRLAIFASLGVPFAASMFPLLAYLPPFYAQEMGLGLATAGLLFTFARIWNGVADPLIGVLSDHTRSRFGRRKPWIVSGGMLFIVATIALFFDLHNHHSVLYLGTWLFLFYLAFTMVSIPYYAWSGELTENYHGRSRVQAYLQTGVSIGLLLVLLIPAAMDWVGRHSLGEKIFGMGLFLVLSLIPSLIVVTTKFREEPQVVNSATALAETKRQPLQLQKTLRWLATDTLVLRVLGSDLVVSAGQGIRAALFMFFVTTYMNLPQWASSLWLLQFVFGIAASPLWLRISYRLGKQRTIIVAEVVQAAINLSLLWVTPGSLSLLLILTMLQGLAQSSGNLMLRSVVADVADVELLRSGQERAGLLFSLFNLTSSLGMAIAVAVAFPLLAILGFTPGQTNSAAALHGLQWVFAVGPALCHAASALLLVGFPLTESRQQQVRRQLQTSAKTTSSVFLPQPLQ